MYDSVTAGALPVNAEVVAGYIDGRYAWSAADWARFPNARRVTIAVFPTTDGGEVLDCELGDATPAQCPAWIKKRHAAGLVVPTIYCSLAAMPAVRAACAGLLYSIWCADWTSVPHIPEGAVACQYAANGSYDVSLCSAGWPA